MQNLIQLTDGKLQFFNGYTVDLHLAILVGLIAIATTYDVREHRIPNWLVAAGSLIAFGYHTLSPHGEGAVFTLAGLIVGMASLIPLYALRTMGAGDVKLMGMAGAYLGTTAVISAALATLIAGGVLAIIVTAYKRALPQLVGNLRTMIIQRHIRQLGGASSEAMPPPPSVGKLPYAVAIAAGTAIHIFILRG